MSYQVRFTDSFNILKPALQVPDQTLNTQTDLTFIGKDYGAYAPYVAENFLHLLENFASATPPSKPVEGQLWFDNSDTTGTLQVFDGSAWNPTSAIKKSTTRPVASQNSDGDLWVDMLNKQLYILNGNSWLLIGPNFSQGVRTGPLVESFTDLNNNTQSVVTFYSNDNRVAICSDTTFVPNTVIDGFPVINNGLTLRTLSNNQVSVNGVAFAAKSLVVNNKLVDSSVFMRTDSNTLLSYPLTVKSSITIGNESEFNIDTTSTATLLTSSATNKNIEFNLSSESGISTVLHINSTGQVGINSQTPRAELDVEGSSLITSDLTVGNSIQCNQLTVNTSTIIAAATANTITISNVDDYNNPIDGAVLIPNYPTFDVPAMYDIGSPESKFRNVYADQFIGNINGTITGYVDGDVSGSASRLSNYTEFHFSGDVLLDNNESILFNGEQGILTFNTIISDSFISAKEQVQTSSDTDQLILYSSGIKKIAKSDFVSSLPVLQIGSVISYAGSTIPVGYLLCNGAEVSITTYSKLFTVIGYNFKAINATASGMFALPDLTANSLHAKIKYLIYAGE